MSKLRCNNLLLDVKDFNAMEETSSDVIEFFFKSRDCEKFKKRIFKKFLEKFSIRVT